jgi:hypothetical protein
MGMMYSQPGQRQHIKRGPQTGFLDPAGFDLDRHRHFCRWVCDRLKEGAQQTPTYALVPRRYRYTATDLPLHIRCMGVLLDATAPVQRGTSYSSFVRRHGTTFSLCPRSLQCDLCHHLRYDLECCEGKSNSVSADDDASRGGICGDLLLCSSEDSTGRREGASREVSIAGGGTRLT